MSRRLRRCPDASSDARARPCIAAQDRPRWCVARAPLDPGRVTSKRSVATEKAISLIARLLRRDTSVRADRLLTLLPVLGPVLDQYVRLPDGHTRTPKPGRSASHSHVVPLRHAGVTPRRPFCKPSPSLLPPATTASPFKRYHIGTTKGRFRSTADATHGKRKKITRFNRSLSTCSNKRQRPILCQNPNFLIWGSQVQILSGSPLPSVSLRELAQQLVAATFQQASSSPSRPGLCRPSG